MDAIESIRRKFVVMDPLLDEQSRRMWAAAEAQEAGWGGVSQVARPPALPAIRYRLE